MMKTGPVLLFVLLLLVPGALCAASPKVVAEEAEFDFGQVLQGEKAEHVFRFRNAGDAPLVVQKVRSSCGCTAAIVSATTIPSGGQGEIRATFDSARFSGPVRKTIYLYGNDPQRPVTEFHLRATVLPEIAVQPAQLDLGVLAPGVMREARVTLTYQGDGEMAITSVETTARELQAELPLAPLAPGRPVQLLVRATPREGKARLSGYVLIKTGSKRVPELRIPVYGSVDGISTGR